MYVGAKLWRNMLEIARKRISTFIYKIGEVFIFAVSHHIYCQIFNSFLAAECPDGLVHRDCFHHSCEATCENIKEERACPALQEGVCFPGCFCPDGLVKDGNRCIEPTKCKNCNAKIKDKCNLVIST